MGNSSVTVKVDGVLRSADVVNCKSGVFNTVYAKAGDVITNVKGLTTANTTVVLPVTIPLSLTWAQSDITSVGGFLFYSDITEGYSGTRGIVGFTLAAEGFGDRDNVSYTDGFLGISDTLGDSPVCPTPTFGGWLPTNPFLNTSVGCQYDDDNTLVYNGHWMAIDPGERGTLLTGWWDTNYGFTA